MDPATGVGPVAALLAGLVSFLSPCVLPLVPGYLATVLGVSVDDLDDAPATEVLLPSLLFVGSFSAIFVMLGVSATGLGQVLSERRELLEKFAAVLIVAMGLLFIGSRYITRLNLEWRVDGLMHRAGSGGPVVAGAAFAVAWTPCVGPTLAAILSTAALSESAVRGALLLAVYSAGLAAPFLLSALAFARMSVAFSWVKRHYSAIMAGGGAVLILMGALIWTGELVRLNIEAQRFLESVGLDFFSV